MHAYRDTMYTLLCLGLVGFQAGVLHPRKPHCTKLLGETLWLPHDGLTVPAFAGSSLQNHPETSMLTLESYLHSLQGPVTGSLIAGTHKCLEKSLYFWKPQR